LSDVDQVVVTFFAAPRSYTAEDVVEISCHGSPVVLRFALELACKNGARIAEPGEFTLRAYVNGRIDLPQAEAVRDLIDATTLYQARIAAQQTSGSVSRRLAPVKELLLQLIALLEAGIDFAEDDVNFPSSMEIEIFIWPILDQVEGADFELRLRQTGARRLHPGHRGAAECREEQPFLIDCWSRIGRSLRTFLGLRGSGFGDGFGRGNPCEIRRYGGDSRRPGYGGESRD